MSSTSSGSSIQVVSAGSTTGRPPATRMPSTYPCETSTASHDQCDIAACVQ